MPSTAEQRASQRCDACGVDHHGADVEAFTSGSLVVLRDERVGRVVAGRATAGNPAWVLVVLDDGARLGFEPCELRFVQ